MEGRRGLVALMKEDVSLGIVWSLSSPKTPGPPQEDCDIGRSVDFPARHYAHTCFMLVTLATKIMQWS